MYTYIFTEEHINENGIKYKSIVPWTDNFRLLDQLTCKIEKVMMSECDDPISLIVERLEQEKIVLLAIDLFYWINEGLHFMKNHITHISLVIGYDDDTEELIVLETGERGYKEHRVPYELAKKAVKSVNITTKFCEINPDTKFSMFTKEDVVSSAKDVIKSIDEKKTNSTEIWKVDGLSDTGLNEVVSIIQTHMYSMQNRAFINGYMFEHAFSNDEFQGVCIHERFYELEKEYEKLKGASIRLSHRKNKYQGLMNIKNKMLELMDVERDIWGYYLERFREMSMVEC